MESARQIAVKLLCGVSQGTSSKEMLEETLTSASHLDSRDKSFVQELSYGVLRWKKF